MFARYLGVLIANCGRICVALTVTSPVVKEEQATNTKAGQGVNDKVLVIGGGWSGLVALKELKAYGFRNVRLLEASSNIGGQWDLKNPSAQTWSHVRANISKMNMHYPDFPYPINAKEPLHSTIHELHQYLLDYSEAFGLAPHIQFNSAVRSIEPVDTKVVETFDRVVVCTGRFGQPRLPPLPGKFDGEVKILTDVKNTNFENKRLVVVGNSISAVDVMELSCLSGIKDVTCVYRNPRWYVSLWMPDGTPFEQTSRKFSDFSLTKKRLSKFGYDLTKYGFVKPNDADVNSGKQKTGVSLCRSFDYW
ncbi:monooxygenase, partial [Reticulomyxa filosa]